MYVVCASSFVEDVLKREEIGVMCVQMMMGQSTFFFYTEEGVRGEESISGDQKAKGTLMLVLIVNRQLEFNHDDAYRFR